jgi:hypothetical protein
MNRLVLSLFAAALLLPATTTFAQDPKEENPVMHTFGAISAQALYSSYMAIAQLGDLYAHKAYDKAKTVEIATSYVNFAEGAKESLSDLIASGKLNSEDEGFMNQSIVVNDLLGKTAQALIEVANNPTDEAKATFEKNRQKSWKALSKMLGIEE